MAEERRDFNFRAEYAKSNRASCRGCRGIIPKDGLRLAKMVQSPFFDGKQPNWYHYRCFWMYVKKVESTSDIGHFDALRWEDQERIREQINGGGSGSSKAAAASKGSTKTETSEDYGVEYAKSNRSSCKACGDKIDKDELRIKYRSAEAAALKGIPGTLDTWHHLDCFVKPDCLAAVQWPDTLSVKHLEGFKKLDADDQKLLEKKFPLKRKSKASTDEPDCKKPKAQVVDKEKEKLKAQSEKVWKIRDALRTNLTTTEMKELLEINDQEIPSGESKLLDRLSDIMTFGPLEPCSECDQGQLVLATGGYRCQGNISSWTKCTVFTQDVKRRKKVIIPDDYEVGTYLESFKFKAYNGGKRLFPKEEAGPSKSTAPVRGSTNPLLNVAVTSAGKLSLSISVIKEIVAQLGGKYSTSVTSSTACVVSSEGEVNKRSPKITKAEDLDVHVVSVEFLNEVEKGGDILKLIPQHSIAPWGSDVADRISKDETDSRGSSTSYRGQDYAIDYGRFNNKSASSGVKKVQLKGGAAVDEESAIWMSARRILEDQMRYRLISCTQAVATLYFDFKYTGLEDTTHVLRESGVLFSATLGMVDASRGTNSYYKLQLLESDSKCKFIRYWIFRSWGRVGTSVGGTKVEEFFGDKACAKRKFVELYQEKTGNSFGTKNFEKIPNRFYPLDIDYGNDEVAKLGNEPDAKSKLHPQLQGLMQLIFDIDTLKKTMVEFEIDLDRMPLGKLSRSQIQNAYSVLTELQTLIEAGNASRNTMLDASNRFYTLIPHNFGLSSIPLLEKLEVIQQKNKMLDSLLEIEVAYSLLKGSKNQESTKSQIDINYEKLKCQMEVIPKDSEEFKMIKTYTKNTHGATHSSYKLKVEEVYLLDREGEKSRNKPFSQLHNRMLLWHGSRLSNFCGILSQGLRIAPPEAPATGYMFGKGVYFADMVSKSANYCFTTRSNSTGLMLLCEVAIGNMHTLQHSDYITKLPKGKHSTKGEGRSYPDPAGQVVLDDGMIVPTGKAVQSDLSNTSLLYNEFIVYDIAQIRMKYLVKMNFKYN